MNPMGADPAPGPGLGEHRRPPDVLASEDFRANGHGGPVTSPRPARCTWGLRFVPLSKEASAPAALERARAMSATQRRRTRAAGGAVLRPSPGPPCARGRGRRRLRPAWLGDQPGNLRSRKRRVAARASGVRPSGQALQVPRRRSARARPVRHHAAEGSAPVVEPDLTLVPLIAMDDRGTRLGREKATTTARWGG